MAVVTLPFTTANLFATVRASHLDDRGFFAGFDSAWSLYYVMADATFYDLQIYVRSGGDTFTGQAAAASTATDVRAIINGQIYEELDDGTNIWQGEIYTGGSLQSGHPPHEPAYRYFGRGPGRTERAYTMGLGDPSGSGFTFEEAAGRLLPLIQGRIPFGATTVQSGGTVTQYGSPTLASVWLSGGVGAGKAIYGIHRSSQLIFFLAQEHSFLTSSGVGVATLIPQLVAHGVDDAVIGDGNSSSTLIVDGAALFMPSSWKDAAIPVGLQLRRRTLSCTAGTTTFQVSDATLNARLGGALPQSKTGAVAAITWFDGSLTMVLSVLGSGLSAADLGIAALPVSLNRTSGTDPAGGLYFSDAGTRVNLYCRVVVASPSDRGRLQGTFTIVTDRASVISGSIDWPLT